MKKKGFTLLELLIVVVILGILALIAIPAYFNVVNQSKNSATVSNAKIAESDLYVEITVNGKSISDSLISDFVQLINNKPDMFSPYSTKINQIPAYTTSSNEKGQVLITRSATGGIDIQAYGNDGLIYTKEITFDN